MAIAVELAIALATLLVEDEHLVALDERRQYFAHDLSTGYGRRTYGELTVLLDEQDLVELYGSTGLGSLDVMDEQATAFLEIELLSLDVYDDVHCTLY